MYHNLLNHSPVEGHLGYFQFGAITRKVAINIHFYVKISLHFPGVNAQALIACSYIAACLVVQLLKFSSKTTSYTLLGVFWAKR